MASRTIIDLKARNIEESQISASPQSIDPAIVIDKKAINTEKALIKDLSEESVKLNKTPPVPSSTKLTTVRAFGSYMNPTTSYPNDVVVLDIQNAIQQYLETKYRVDTYIQKSNKVTLFPEEDLANLNYLSGRYRVTYKFHRNLLGSGDLHKMQIQEISADGLELRVIPALSSTYDNTDFINFFGSSFFSLPKEQTLVNLFLFKDANTSVRVFDYVQDKFTFDTAPYSIIFKLNTPVPAGVVVGDLLWLAQQVSEDITDEITIIPPKYQPRTVPIAGPNFDITSRERTHTATQYKDWDDLLTTNTATANDIINKLLSGSLVEGIPLNIDYRNFENFIHFGSAQERLLNFKYKMELLEDYDSRIAALTTDLSGKLRSASTSSQYYQTNVVEAKTKRAALLGSFDGYEKYLYFESASYESSSYGEFYPTTWPKTNNKYPYTNYSTTSSVVEDWFEGIISSASLYDQNNPKALYKLVPEHILEDPSNEEYILFTHMIGHYYDLMFSYIKQITKTTDRNESILEGFSKDLIYHVARNLGVDFENGNTLEELWSYTLGTDATGSLLSTSATTAEDKTKEVWKRIINNLPYLLKTRGTERGVRALINCFGIPSTILRIREYGGAEPYFETKNDMVYERFNYALTVGYNGKTSTNSPDVFQRVSIPWTKLNNGYFPMSIELRAKMAPKQTKTQLLMEVPERVQIKAFQISGSGYIGLFLSGSTGWATSSVSCSIYDGTWHHIALTRDDLDDNSTTAIQTYKLAVRKTNYEKVVATYTASLAFGPSTAASRSFNSRFTTDSSLWIPGSASLTLHPASTSHSAQLWSGSVQEFRYWDTTLQDSILDNHALAPTSFQGNLANTYTGSTSSFYDLCFRLSLGADNNKITFVSAGLAIPTASQVSQHPNQHTASFQSSTITTSTGSYYGFWSGSTYTTTGSRSGYVPNVEIHSLEWPDLGGNRSVSNKIRIDDGILLTDEDQLFRNNSIQRSLSDNQPIDSPRLGIYLSPTNEVNQDIAEQFGGISIDDYIGDPSQLTMDHYPDLENLYREYSKKYTKRNNAQAYIRLIKHFDAALFQMLKRFVPYRANTQVGLVVEPHLLHRSKVPVAQPSHTPEHYSSSIDLSQYYEKPGGFVQDGDGEPFRDSSYYVEAGTIGGDESDYIRFSGDQQGVAEFSDNIVDNGVSYMAPRQGIDVTPLVPENTKYDMVVLDGTALTNPLEPEGSANEYNNTGLAESLSDSGNNSLYETINTGITSYGVDRNIDGSKYVFMSYRQVKKPVSAYNYIIDTTNPIQGVPQINEINWLAYNLDPAKQSITTETQTAETSLQPTPDGRDSATLTTIDHFTPTNGYNPVGYMYPSSSVGYSDPSVGLTIKRNKYYAFDFWMKMVVADTDTLLYVVDNWEDADPIEGCVLQIDQYNYGIKTAGRQTIPNPDTRLTNFITAEFTNKDGTPATYGEWNYFRMVLKAVDDITNYKIYLFFETPSNTTSYTQLAFQNPRFYEYPTNVGKHVLYTSSRYDYHEVFPPVIQDSRYSQIANVNSPIYNGDIYGGYDFLSQKLVPEVVQLTNNINGSGITPETVDYVQNLKKLPLYVDYGLRFPSNMITGSSTCPSPFGPRAGAFPNNQVYEYWSINSFGSGIELHTNGYLSGKPVTGSITLPAFFYDEKDDRTKNLRYKITAVFGQLTSQIPIRGASMTFKFGGANTKIPEKTYTFYSTTVTDTFETIADGPLLHITFRTPNPGGSNADSTVFLKKLSVQCLNYRSQTQDYHLQDSYGMRNARYDGCKMSSTDWNIDSPDTSDGGPVVSVTVGGGNQLSNVRPGIRGNYEII